MQDDNEIFFPCPCFGYLVFSEGPGSYEICPICYWEDDISQLRFVHEIGANHVSLIDGQKNYVRFGVSEPRLKKNVRPPNSSDVKEAKWRPIDQQIDNVELPKSGMDYDASYPDDSETLYYWRETYWRMKSKGRGHTSAPTTLNTRPWGASEFIR